MNINLLNPLKHQYISSKTEYGPGNERVRQRINQQTAVSLLALFEHFMTSPKHLAAPTGHKQ